MTRFLGDGTYMTGKDYQIGSFQSAPFMGNLPLTDPSKFERTPNPEEYITSNHNAKENIYAAYLRWDQNITEDLFFITGLRMEYTHINYLGHTLVDGEKSGDITDTNGYLNWFPNLTSRYSPVYRANIPPSTSMSWVVAPMRPATTDLRASWISMPMSCQAPTQCHNLCGGQ